MSNITINKNFINKRNTSNKKINNERGNLIKNNLKSNNLTSNNYNKTIIEHKKNTPGKKRKRSSKCTPPTDLFVYFKYLTVLRALQIAENENKKEIFNTGNDFVKECIKIAKYGTNNSYRPQRVINRLKPIQTAESGALAVARGGNGGGTRGGNGGGTRGGNGGGTRGGNGSPTNMEVGTRGGNGGNGGGTRGGNGGNGSPNQMEVVNKSPSSPDTTFLPFYFENTPFAPLTPPRN